MAKFRSEKCENEWYGAVASGLGILFQKLNWQVCMAQPLSTLCL